MPCRQIELDDESDRILSALAQDYEGDLGKALAVFCGIARASNLSWACEEESAGCFTRPTGARGARFREGRFTGMGRGQTP